MVPVLLLPNAVSPVTLSARRALTTLMRMDAVQGGQTQQGTTGNNDLTMNPKRKPIYIIYDVSHPAGCGQQHGAAAFQAICGWSLVLQIFGHKQTIGDA